MTKLINFIALAFFILIVPFGSWYYLNEGLQYRKSALADLVVKDSINGKLDSLGFFVNFVTVFNCKVGEDKKSTLVGIQEQYKNIPEFRIINDYNSDDELIKFYDSVFSIKFPNAEFLLIDMQGNIRNEYSNSKDDVKKMVEHIAMVIPRPKESDIKMK